MAQIIIPQYQTGTDIGTLSGIARQYKTDIPTLQKLNPQITDINKITAGASLNIPDLEKPTTSAVGSNQAIVSSDLARNQYKQDVDKLGILETGISGTTITPTPTEKPQEGAVLPQEKPSITFKSVNPAFQSIVDQTNETIKQFQSQGGTLTPELQQQLNNINNFQFQKTQAIADAREATEGKNATKLNEAITKVSEADTATKTEIETLRANLKTQQETYLATLKPTEAETELKRKLNTLRTERQLLPLELRQEGISAAGIQGRQIDDERVRAIQEGNLLAEIGLEQEARQFKTLSVEKQLGFIRDDIALQNKIDEQLKTNERQVVEDARNLSKDSISALSNIVNEFGDKGLDWQDIGQNPQAQVDILNMIKPYPGLTVDIISSALKIAKQQKIFDNALKIKEKSKTESNKILQIENKLIQSKNGGEFVDGNVYLEEKRRSTLNPSEFDSRFGNLLSDSDQTKYGISKTKSKINSNNALNFEDL